MTGSIPDWASMPSYIKQKLKAHIQAIKKELECIENLGEEHPQSAFRMDTILNNARAFLDVTHRVEGANNAQVYAYECYRKEHANG